MRPISQQIFGILPALVAVILVVVTASPMDATVLTYTPNVAWLMTLVMATFHPQCWPRSFAFSLGFFQDILFGTPLGSQALLTLLMVQLVHAQAQRQQTPLFRMRWLEAGVVLVVWHVLLGAVMMAVTSGSASLRALVCAGLVNALWYPLFYWLGTRVFGAASVRD